MALGSWLTSSGHVAGRVRAARHGRARPPGPGRARRPPAPRAHPPRRGSLAPGRRRRSPAPPGGCGPTPGASTSTVQRGADQLVPPGGGDVVLAGCAAPPAARPPAPCGTDAVEVGGVRAVLPAVGEEAAPVELRRLDERQELVVVLLGLARVADDEVGAEGGLREAVADVGDAAQEPLAVAPPAHAPQERLGHVLQREVVVRHAAVADDVDQLVRQVGRVEVEQAGPLDPLRHGRARGGRWRRRRARPGRSLP